MSKTNSNTRRKAPTLEQRLTPCQCCGFPLSQRHHILPFSTHGDGLCVSLCANCHEVLHVIHREQDNRWKFSDTPQGQAAYFRHSRAFKIVSALIAAWGENDPRLQYLRKLTGLAYRYEQAQLAFYRYCEQVERIGYELDQWWDNSKLDEMGLVVKKSNEQFDLMRAIEKELS